MQDIESEIFALEEEARSKEKTKQEIEEVRNALFAYERALPVTQKRAMAIYDPRTDEFAKTVEPYLADDEKKQIRGLFKK